MASVTNARTLFNEVPTGYPIPGKTTVHDTSEKIDLDTVSLDGGVLVKTLVLSIDPYLRGRMIAPEKKSYSAPFALNEPIVNFGVGVVLRSESAKFAAGDHVYGMLPFQEYSVIKDAANLRKLTEEGLPWSVYVGTLGMPGQTAYYGWKEFSSPKPGETVFVTTAGGPVGSLVVQLAKRDGCRVIASAGSDDKCEFMHSLGADVVFNYKTTSTKEVLEREGPIDIYWDHVGGEVLDLALLYANTNARFIQCGSISTYNDTSYPGIKNYPEIYQKQLKLYGLFVIPLASKYEEEFYRLMPSLVKEGTFKYREDISRGLDTAGQGILDVQQGKNTAKKVILVADE